MMAAIAALCNFLITYGHNFLTWFYNTCVDGINGAISVFVDFCITVIALFPTVDGPAGAPAAASGHLFDVLLTAMNWLCPMAYIVSVVGFLTAGMLAYWVIAPLARWVKLLT